MSSDINKQTFPYVSVAVQITHFIPILFMQVYDQTAMSGTPRTLMYQFITGYFKWCHVSVRCQPCLLKTNSAKILSRCRQITHNCIEIIKLSINALYIGRGICEVTLSSLETWLNICHGNVIGRRKVIYFVFRVYKGWQNMILGLFQ